MNEWDWDKLIINTKHKLMTENVSTLMETTSCSDSVVILNNVTECWKSLMYCLVSMMYQNETIKNAIKKLH